MYHIKALSVNWESNFVFYELKHICHVLNFHIDLESQFFSINPAYSYLMQLLFLH